MDKKKRLTHEETMALILEAQQGSKEAEEKLLEHNKSLIWGTVKKFSNRGYPLDDLFQMGAIAMIKSIRKFDMSFGVKFSTYIVPMIQGEIRRFLRDDGEVKVPRSLKELASKITKQELVHSSPEHINEILEVNNIELVKDTIQYILRGTVKSMDEEVYDNGDGADAITLKDQMSDDLNGDNWFEHIALREAVAKLSERDQQIIKLRFFNDKSQAEVAKELGVSQVQISRLEKKTLTKLKILMEGTHDMAKGDRTTAIELLKGTNYTLKEINEITEVPVGSLGPLAKTHRPKHVTEANKRKGYETATTASLKKRKEKREPKDVSADREIRIVAKSPKVTELTNIDFDSFGATTGRLESDRPHVAATPKSEGMIIRLNFDLEVTGEDIPTVDAIDSLRKAIELLEKVEARTVNVNVKMTN